VFLNISGTSTQTWSLDDIADADGTATTLAFAEKSSPPGFPLFSSHTWIYPAAGSSQLSILFGSGTSQPPVFGVSGTITQWDNSWNPYDVAVTNTDIFSGDTKKTAPN
jgi:hypothetical protein